MFGAGNLQIGSPVTSSTVTAGAASANFTLPGGTAAGTYTIQAAYSGGGSFAASSDNTHTLTVGTANTTTTASTNFSVSSQMVTLSATVTSTAGSVNNGTVMFTVFDMNNVQVGSPATSGTVASGAAHIPFTRRTAVEETSRQAATIPTP